MKYQLILASESPRRKQLLLDAGFHFEALPLKVSEIPRKNLTVNEKIIAISKEKSDAALALLASTGPRSPFILLTADTEVVLNDQLLGKAQSLDHAFQILKNLSGRFHEVKTAMCIVESKSLKTVTHLETTQIHFKKLSDQMIHDYLSTGEYVDKAGAYAIQGLGRGLVDHFEGSYNNVVGLPVEVFSEILRHQGWKVEGPS